MIPVDDACRGVSNLIKLIREQRAKQRPAFTPGSGGGDLTGCSALITAAIAVGNVLDERIAQGLPPLDCDKLVDLICPVFTLAKQVCPDEPPGGVYPHGFYNCLAFKCGSGISDYLAGYLADVLYENGCASCHNYPL